MQDQFQYHGIDLHSEDQRHVGWLTYMGDIAFPTSLWGSACPGITRVDRTSEVPPYSAGMDMRSDGTTSKFDRILAMSHGVMNTGRTEYDTRQGNSSGVPSTYLASRLLPGRDGQDSEGLPGSRLKPVTRGTNVNPTLHGTTDHGDSRRLAAGSGRPIWLP